MPLRHPIVPKNLEVHGISALRFYGLRVIAYSRGANRFEFYFDPGIVRLA